MHELKEIARVADFMVTRIKEGRIEIANRNLEEAYFLHIKKNIPSVVRAMVGHRQYFIDSQNRETIDAFLLSLNDRIKEAEKEIADVTAGREGFISTLQKMHIK